MTQVPATQRRQMIATAALPYANGSIHIGHLVEYIQADIWTRFQKMRGNDCAYICADDTHGTPIMVKARELGIAPEELIARSHSEHAKDFADFGVMFDLYSSTNSDENRILAEEFYIKMRDHGHTSLREIRQLYCDFDKMFLPDRFVKGTCPNCKTHDQYGDSCDKCGSTYAPSELINPGCAICGRPPSLKPSEHIFFKLNDFKDFLHTWMPAHTQKEVAAKLLEWFDEDLRDWDISRDAPYFGFEIPGYKDKFFYVWLDAPIGYISATWQWCKNTGRDFDKIWRGDGAEIYHFIGKDITYFHCLFWPAMLKASGFKLPHQVFVHGHLTVNGEKMSKSKGTSITARTYLNHLDPMYLRYYYACKISPTVNDIDLNITDFVNRVNSDLIGKITNLASRGAQMLNTRAEGRLGHLDAAGQALVKNVQSRAGLIAQLFDARDFSRAMTEIRDLADQVNKYFDENAPWLKIKTDLEGTRAILTATLNCFRIFAIYLKPVLPAYAESVADLLGEATYQWDDHMHVLENKMIKEYKHLATRVEQDKFNQIIADSTPAEVKTAATGSKLAPAAAKPEPAVSGTPIEFDEFAKVDLRIGKIVAAEEIKEADKLLRLRVDLGPLGERQIIAGIKAAYKPETLIGRLTVVVANLKPRQMKFGISEGMIIAAGEGGADLFIMSPDAGAKPGQKVK